MCMQIHMYLCIQRYVYMRTHGCNAAQVSRPFFVSAIPWLRTGPARRDLHRRPRGARPSRFLKAASADTVDDIDPA